MLVSKKTHRQARIQNYLFVVLFIGIVGSLAWLSTRYSFDADWTATGRNTLSDASIALLDTMPDEIRITCYATEDQALRHKVTNLFARYQRHKTTLSLHFVNPDLVPDAVRELRISVNGELIIEYQNRRENLKLHSEQAITNALQRLARSDERWLLFLSGHGERKPQGEANHDLGSWIAQLTAKGFKTKEHNLASQPQLPDNTSVLVIASPQLELLAGEITLIKEYLERGGNLLWLSDPDSRHGQSILMDSLGLELQAGTIVDPNTRILGINDPRFALVGEYPAHELTYNFDTITLFPQAVGLIQHPLKNWDTQAVLLSHQRSWSETGELSGSIQFDQASDVAGPLTLGFALQRQLSTADDSVAGSQRVVVVGDGDFLSNAYLGNGGNLNLGLNIINWLAHDDRFIELPIKMSPDTSLQLSPLAQGTIALGFLVVLPLALAASGLFIWWRRRKR